MEVYRYEMSGYQLYIYDTAGEEEHTHNTDILYNSSDGAIIAIGVDYPMEDLDSYVDNIKRVKQKEIVPLVICMTKTDLPEEVWKVTREEIQAFSEKHQIKNIFETSALKGDPSIVQMFNKLIELVKEQRVLEAPLRDTISTKPAKRRKKFLCL
ncbi:MAG: hypothetical protein MHPSP_002934 [Paramarteilia canceri]